MFSLGIQILNILIVLYRVWEVHNIFLMRFLLPGLSKGKSGKKNPPLKLLDIDSYCLQSYQKLHSDTTDHIFQLSSGMTKVIMTKICLSPSPSWSSLTTAFQGLL